MTALLLLSPIAAIALVLIAILFLLLFIWSLALTALLGIAALMVRRS